MRAKRHTPDPMRAPDKPLPGDFIVRRRAQDPRSRFGGDVFVVTRWPDSETIISGPYQSRPYAEQQARSTAKDRSAFVWYDHARPNEPERLELVAEQVS